MEPGDIDGLAGSRLDPQEIVERREETAAYRRAVWAIPDPIARKVLLLDGLGVKPAEIVERIPGRDPREISTLLYRARLRVAAGLAGDRDRVEPGPRRIGPGIPVCAMPGASRFVVMWSVRYAPATRRDVRVACAGRARAQQPSRARARLLRRLQ